MHNSNQIIDQHALERNRRRVKMANLFLHQAAADEVATRLNMVNRSFVQTAIVTPFPSLWREHHPKATLIRDNDVLCLKPNAFDLIIHAMCLHWSDDLVGQLIQCRLGLKPDGLIIGLLLGGKTLNELRFALTEAETAIVKGLSPRLLPMADVRDLGLLLQRAGFALPVADSTRINVEYRDIYHLMHDLRAMGEANALKDRSRTLTRRNIFAKANRLYARHFGTDSGCITATFDIVVLTGWSPGTGQPQPLKPGSATVRLADALNTEEHKFLAENLNLDDLSTIKHLNSDGTQD